MTFIPISANALAQSEEHADIVLVGDHVDVEALRVGKQVSSAEESIIEQALHMSGLTKHDIKHIILFPGRHNTTGLWIDNSKAYKRYFTPEGKVAIQTLKDKLALIKPKVVVTLGAITTQALLERTDYTDIRGYPFQLDNYLVIPSLKPRDMIWSNYIWRFYLSNDLRRAKEFAIGNLTVDEPTLSIPATFDEACAMLRSVARMNRVSIDIEVSNYEVSCVGFSADHKSGFSIPTDERWSVEEEAVLWGMMAAVLGNPKIVKIGQNFIFDTYFLAYKMGIITRGYIEDTMVASSIAYPDFLKGLGFLGSVHTTMTYWKDQVDFKNIKEEA